MTKFIRGWEDLVGLENDEYKLEIDLDMGCGKIVPKKSVSGNEHYYIHGKYLSTHTFYGSQYKQSTELLRSFGFDVELANWDRSVKDGKN